MPVIYKGRGGGLEASFNDKKHSFLVLFLFLAMEYYCSFLKITKPLNIFDHKNTTRLFRERDGTGVFFI
jgi:hypothetical protein